MEAKVLTVQELFAGAETGNGGFKKNKLKIPFFQRPYKWSQSNWEQLWDDLQENIESKEIKYFLGTIVTITRQTDDQNYFEIIDGQQRIVTISLFAIALRNILRLVIKPQPSVDSEKHHDTTKELQVICESQSREKRLELSQQNNNDYDYKTLYNEIYLRENFISDNVLRENKNIDRRKTLTKCYIYFYTKIINFLDIDIQPNNTHIEFHSEQYQKLENLIQILSNVQMLHFNVKDDIEACKLFDCLNNRGVPLTIIEILKNKFITNDTSKEYLEKWENMSGEWLCNDSKIQVRFLRHYLISYNTENQKKLTKDSKDITSSKIIKYLTEFHKEKGSPAFLKDLNRACDLYKNYINIKHINEETRKDNIINIFKLSHIGYACTKLIIFHLKRINCNEKIIDNIAYFMWRFSLRTQILSQPDNKSFETAIIDTLPNNNNDAEKFIENFCKHNRIIHNKNSLDNITDKLKEGNIDSSVVRQILWMLEYNGTTKLEQKLNIFEQNTNNKQEYKYSVEHILPQNPTKETLKKWQKMFSGDNPKQFQSDKNECLHKLGNLTLTLYNSNLSNDDFFAKQKKLYNQSNTNLKLDTDIIKAEKWTKEIIQSRTEKMLNEIKEMLHIEEIDDKK